MPLVPALESPLVSALESLRPSWWVSPCLRLVSFLELPPPFSALPRLFLASESLSSSPLKTPSLVSSLWWGSVPSS